MSDSYSREEREAAGAAYEVLREVGLSFLDPWEEVGQHTRDAMLGALVAAREFTARDQPRDDGLGTVPTGVEGDFDSGMLEADDEEPCPDCAARPVPGDDQEEE